MKSQLIEEFKPEFKNAQQAFEEAIKTGRLSDNPCDVNYAGWYMYMGTFKGKDLFKHYNTRQYID